jgi:hypothetical protein
MMSFPVMVTISQMAALPAVLKLGSSRENEAFASLEQREESGRPHSNDEISYRFALGSIFHRDKPAFYLGYIYQYNRDRCRETQ